MYILLIKWIHLIHMITRVQINEKRERERKRKIACFFGREEEIRKFQNSP